MYEPGPQELLIRNELIALHPVEAKMAQMNVPPIEYPAIIGVSLGGTVTAIGSKITGFQVGDEVAAFSLRSSSNEYGSYQKYALVKAETASLLLDGVDLPMAVSCIGNLGAVVGLLGGRAGIPRPALDRSTPSSGKAVLVYGGTSSFGSLAVQYLSLAGYTVVTTTSAKHHAFVSKLGPSHIVDHNQAPDTIIGALKSLGPFDLVVDAISLPHTVRITSEVLAHQGGGKVYTVLPAFGPESLPDGVIREFGSWPHVLAEDENSELQEWTFNTYLTQGLANGTILPHPTELAHGGLSGLEAALNRLSGGVSCLKLLIDPQETPN
jgi:NADPH:quinone reductase-like Zn-dependent oxidoreductase